MLPRLWNHVTAFDSFDSLTCFMTDNITYTSTVQILVLGRRTLPSKIGGLTAAYDADIRVLEAAVKIADEHLCRRSKKCDWICAIGALSVTSSKYIAQSLIYHFHGGTYTVEAAKPRSQGCTPYSSDRPITRSAQGCLMVGRLSNRTELDKSLIVGCTLFAIISRKYKNDRQDLLRCCDHLFESTYRLSIGLVREEPVGRLVRRRWTGSRIFRAVSVAGWCNIAL